MIKLISGRRKAFMAMMATLVVAMLIVSFAQTKKVEALSTQVSMAVQKSMYETQELLGGIQLNLQKLLVSNSDAHRQSILENIIRQSEAASDDLSNLTGGSSDTEGAMKFINQAGDYASSLSKRLSLGGDFDKDDIRQLNEMLATCIGLNAEIVESIRKIESGEIEVSFSDTSSDSEVEPAVNYPVLLYDGPFSDAVGDESFVPYGNEVSEQDAQAALRRFIGESRVQNVTLTSESDIMSKCYEFEAETDFGTVTAGVTAFGGHVLYMLPQNNVTDIVMSVTDCMQEGLRFLSDRGYGTMNVSYWRRQDGILTVNYAPVQSGVVLYPDLVKLQISLADGGVIGAETGNYIRNHINRALNTPVLTEQDAMSMVNPLLSISGITLCVIPLDNSEYLCWEVKASFEEGETYLIYIDAVTGLERTILQILETEDGVLTQ